MTVSADGPLAPFDRGPSEVERSLGWLIAVGGCILLLDQTVFKVGHAQHFAGWWNAAGVLVAGTLILLAIAGRHLPGRVLRVLWAAVPLGYAMLQAGWSLAYAGTDPNAAMPWLWTLEPAALTLLLLVLTPPSAIAVALAIPLLPALSGWLRFGEVPTAILHETPSQLGNVVYLALFIGLSEQLKRLSASEAEARRQLQRQHRTTARKRQQDALQRLVHDEVLSVLATAMHADGAPSTALCQDAARAAVALERSLESPGGGSVPADAAVDQVVSQLRRIDPGLALHTQRGDGDFPADAVQALTKAAAEALRNSLAHAGPSSTRRVCVTVDRGELVVVVRDDGIGFDPDPACPRLGIAGSIVGRRRDVGGSARVDSKPTRGTEVVLAWPT